MKKNLLINGLLVVSLMASPFATAEDSGAANAEPEVPVDDLKNERGYFFGYSFGNMLKEGGNTDVNLENLLQGLKDSIATKVPNLTPEQQQRVIAEIRNRQQEVATQKQLAQDKAAKDSLEAGQAYLIENGQKEGVKTTESGLQYEMLVDGKGARPRAESKVEVHYEGKLINGTIFDSSIQRGKPAEFGLNQVIAGWTEGLQLIREGGKARLVIPPELGYGTGGTRGIPPNAVLIFEVELLSIKDET